MRANSNGEQFAYYSYGLERTSTPDGQEKFGTYFRDGLGEDYADQRYYDASSGTFWSPDPGGIATGHPADPNSWNRYVYGNDDPVDHMDPSGNAYVCTADGYTTGGSSVNCYWQYGADDGGGPPAPNNPGCGIVNGFDPMPAPPDPSCFAPGPPPPPPPPAARPSCTYSVIAVGAGGQEYFSHTLIQITEADGSSVNYEAFPEAKPNSILPVIFGGSWINATQDYGSVIGKAIVQDSGPNVCPVDDAITIGYNEWKNDTTTYFFTGPNSNTFTYYVMSWAEIPVSISQAAWLTTFAPGWGSLAPGQDLP